MRKFLFAWMCVVMVAGLTGCKLCCAPYDYCGPVYQGGQCSDLAHNRCGSIAGQTSMVAVQTPQGVMQVPASQVPQKQAPTPAPAPAPGAQVRQVPPQYQQFQQVQFQQFQNRQAQPVQQTPFQQTAQNNGSGVVQATALIAAPATTEQAVKQNIPAVVPENGKIAVNADGFQEVAVYDESGRLLGYETIDAEGKTVKALDLNNLK